MPRPEPTVHKFECTCKELEFLKTTSFLALTRADHWVDSLKTPAPNERDDTDRTNKVEVAEPIVASLRIFAFMVQDAIETGVAKVHIADDALGLLVAIWERSTSMYPEAYWERLPYDHTPFTKEDMAELAPRFMQAYKAV
jgi:hypothetical protein